MNIEERKELLMKNVISLRKKMSQAQILEEMKNMNLFLAKETATRKRLVTAVFGISFENSNQLLDMEIMMEIDKEIRVAPNYQIKKIFRLENALYIKHIGDPKLLDEKLIYVQDYISRNNIQQITAFYNVQANENILSGVNGMDTESYVGVNYNIL